MASIIQTIMLGCGPLFGIWLGSWLTRGNQERQWRRDRCLEAYTDVMRACEIVHTEATRLYLEFSDDPTIQLQVLSEKTSELHRAIQRAALLVANEMVPTLHALSAHTDRVAARAGAFPKLSLDEWKKITITDIGNIVTQFMNGARNDLEVHSTLRVFDLWGKLLYRSK